MDETTCCDSNNTTWRDVINSRAKQIKWQVPFAIGIALFFGAGAYAELYAAEGDSGSWLAEFAVILGLVLVVAPMIRRALGGHCPNCNAKIRHAVGLNGLSDKVKYCVQCGLNFDSKAAEGAEEQQKAA